MDVNMDILPSGNIFSELERICTTGYFSSQPSIEDQWQQVNNENILLILENVSLRFFKLILLLKMAQHSSVSLSSEFYIDVQFMLPSNQLKNIILSIQCYA
ncbi:uncharacterized protein LOC119608060 isoform X1 [Lucilia sericata]|uniref:uncharacterized protein LOC119608060 isoform X1 n=1 Tax=Lucilia sericata TaxID=13632 RepID=UPI0018A839E8|nr:uncharacterized protein LOC119608060 isoform X1 [Lucilia sericata]